MTAGTQYDVQIIATNAFGSTTSNLVSATTTTAVTIQSIVLSGSKAFTVGTTNAVVGTIAVTMSSGSFTGTLSLAGANAASFQIVNVGGVNTLETNGALNTAQTYTVNIVATQSGASNSPLTGPTESIVGSGTSVSFTPTRPQGAIDGGYSNLVFFDDFLDTTTMAPVGSYGTATSGHKWYWSYMVNFDTVRADINPTGAATGPYASTTGGVMTMNVTSLTNGNNGTNIATIPGGAMSSFTQLPATGHWRHMYIEGLFMYNPSGGTGITSPSSGWPGFWSWTAETGGFGFPYAGNGVANTEVDFWEYDNGSPTVGLTTIHSAFHPTGGISGGGGPISNNVWFKAGMLWAPPTGGQTVGTFTFYFNDVAKGNTSGNPPTTPIESCTLFLTMGSGFNWPFLCDWVAVWQ